MYHSDMNVQGTSWLTCRVIPFGEKRKKEKDSVFIMVSPESQPAVSWGYFPFSSWGGGGGGGGIIGIISYSIIVIFCKIP